MKRWGIVAIFLLVSAFSLAQTQSKPEILVLGTYHMANPGRDIYNMEADDVFSSKRQSEVAQLLQVLKKFNPTKIAVESTAWSDRAPNQYADYLAGKYTLTRNEIDQVGYRLAKELGHKTVYPVDTDGEFPNARVTNWAKANNKTDKLNEIKKAWKKLVEDQDAYLKSHTVLQTLEYMNSDEEAKHGMALYFATMPFGEPGDEAAADLIASWYKRNIRIYQNIVKLIDSPNDRILVIYGAGHLPWLQQDVENDASVRLRKLAEFTSKP